MSWSGWIAIGFSILLQMVLIARGWEWMRSSIRAVMKTVERHEAVIEKHEKHFTDADIHWTARERDALVAQLERLTANMKRVEELIQESLQERADVIKVITSLIDRKNSGNSEKS